MQENANQKIFNILRSALFLHDDTIDPNHIRILFLSLVYLIFKKIGLKKVFLNKESAALFRLLINILNILR